MAEKSREESRIRRHERVREKVRGSAARPRLAVYRSLTHIYAQLIDDDAGRTLAAASSLESKDAKSKKSELAKSVGAQLGERAKAKGIGEVVFDRGGYRYHGRVKALAEGVRAAGVKV
ncbi:MAG TPA: 50S ribosomal protein L18 [Candidatus Limnocylindria bacterium]|nr:50S ribosomal protein L18 [Candidatus Limnocylindria bacterium]